MLNIPPNCPLQTAVFLVSFPLVEQLTGVVMEKCWRMARKRAVCGKLCQWREESNNNWNEGGRRVIRMVWTQERLSYTRRESDA